MATYLRIGGVNASTSDVKIAGDVSEEKHDKWIELSSFSFGSSVSKAADSPDADEDDDGGSEILSPAEQRQRDLRRKKAKEEKAKEQDEAGDVDESIDGRSAFRNQGLTLAKWAGQDSPKLVEWALSDVSYDLQIDCCRENGHTYMRVFVYNARIVSFAQTAEPGDITEELTVLFEDMTFESHSFAKDEKRLTPTSSTTKEDGKDSAKRTAAVRSGPPAIAKGGKGVGKRAVATSAASTVADATARMWAAGEDPEFVQADRVLTVDKIGGFEFLLGSYVGSEEISGLFHFQLETTSSELNVKAADVIGQPISFRLEDDSKIDPDNVAPSREYNGIVAEMYAGQKSVDCRDYTFVVVPWFWMLTKRSDCRIFQEKSVVEIVEVVFNNLGFKDFDKSNVRATYPKLEYCVQYRETDFDFVSRLLEEFGIFYFFRFAMGKHTMVLADSSVVHANCEQKDVRQTHGSLDERHIRNWIKHSSHISGKVSYRDYNHTTPAETLESEATSVVDLPKIKDYEIYDYPGRYINVADGGKIAKTRIEAAEVEHCIVEGDSGCDAFACGTKFTVKAHDCDEEKGQEFVLTGVVHHAHLMPMSDVKPRVYYVNEFEAIPKAVTFRPARVTERPVVRGPQTAVVVGVAGEEIDPDKYGAVKVQFHWDREGKKDKDSSCFVRVAQPIAGKNWGAQWLPRMGQEVVVEFLEGDPDRPLITGSVYNEDYMPPYALPANKTQSGMKTRSTKEGKVENFNELRFEDKLGSEHVYMHAEKDFERVVENDDTLTVGTKGEGSQKISVQKDRTIEVVEGKETTTIKKGDRTIEVTEGKETTTIVKGDRAVVVDKGNQTFDVKKGDLLIKVDAGKSVIESDKSIELKVGSTSIKLDKQGITLKGDKVTVEGKQSVQLKVGSNSTKVDMKGVTVKGKMVTLKGEAKTEIKGLLVDVKAGGTLQAGGPIMKLG